LDNRPDRLRPNTERSRSHQAITKSKDDTTITRIEKVCIRSLLASKGKHLGFSALKSLSGILAVDEATETLVNQTRLNAEAAI
jgi:hypothetical protein